MLISALSFHGGSLPSSPLLSQLSILSPKSAVGNQERSARTKALQFLTSLCDAHQHLPHNALIRVSRTAHECIDAARPPTCTVTSCKYVFQSLSKVSAPHVRTYSNEQHSSIDLLFVPELRGYWSTVSTSPTLYGSRWQKNFFKQQQLYASKPVVYINHLLEPTASGPYRDKTNFQDCHDRSCRRAFKVSYHPSYSFRHLFNVSFSMWASWLIMSGA